AVLRRLAAERDPALPVALTSSELLARLEERAGDAGTSRLGAAIRAAELAKFAGRAAGGAEAEEHWAAVRAWIAGLPEA
ncbi:MAG TPA: hypothetical protein VFQ22_01880, partial [Longimicrobiales bacterium]|nr:hypothetical protein [Longimicrobiales bacterium]